MGQNDNVVAVILGGGAGSRLFPLTGERSKPAVPLGGKYRLIDVPVSNCINSDITQIFVLTQYNSASLNRHISRTYRFSSFSSGFVEVLAAEQTKDNPDWFQGTADAVRQMLPHLRDWRVDTLLILSGDHLYRMDYRKFLARHFDTNADLTISVVPCKPNEAEEFGLLKTNEKGAIVEFKEKPKGDALEEMRVDTMQFGLDDIEAAKRPFLASMGIYVFNAAFLYEQLDRDRWLPGSSHDFGKDLIPHVVPRYRIFAHNFDDSCVGTEGKPSYWRDVGTVDAYWEANLDLTHVTPDLNLYDNDWPVWTYQEQLPPAKFVFGDPDRHGSATDSLVSGGCIISGSQVVRSLLFSNVRVHSYGTIEDSVILPNVEVQRHVRLRRVVVDKNCVLPEGLNAGFDAEQDKRRFHLTDNNVVLITPDMLGQQALHQREQVNAADLDPPARPGQT